MRSLPKDVRALVWRSDTQLEILERVGPDVAVWCNPLNYALPPGYRSRTRFVVDVHGPTNIEDTLMRTNDLERSTLEMVSRLKNFDYAITVNERQKYYWAGLLCAAGIDAGTRGIGIVPVAMADVQRVRRRFPKDLQLVYAGGFYPWQDPSAQLLSAVSTLERCGKGMLHVFGAPHGSLRTARIDACLTALEKSRHVKLHGIVPRAELQRQFLKMSCAFDLMPPSLERELASTTRTVEYLAHGIPVIYNNYSALWPQIEAGDAGWCLDPADLTGLERLLKTLVAKHETMLPSKSNHAYELSEAAFSLAGSVQDLVRYCRGPVSTGSQTQALRRPLPKANTAPRVLAITHDSGAIRDLRVVQPLDALMRQNRIAGYSILQGTQFAGPQTFDAYDAIWVQRSAPHQLLGLIEQQPFLFDLDDLLICAPSYTHIPFDLQDGTNRLLGMRYTLALSNARLRTQLAQRMEGARARKTFLIPNGCAYPRGDVQAAAQPKALVWTSSDFAALTCSADEILRAVDGFSTRHDLPVLFIGRHDPRVMGALSNVVHYGWMDFWRHKMFLAAQPTMLGICPLETHASQDTLQFIASKSDLKMVEYGGFAHPGVYSDSPPYADTDLQTGMLATNTEEAWTSALESVYANGHKDAARRARDIRALRNMDVLAAKSWWPALQTVLLSKPLPDRDVRAALSLEPIHHGPPPASFSLPSKSRVIVFGAGSGGRRAIQSLPSGTRLVAVVDNDQAKHGTKLMGARVVSPATLKTLKFDAVVIGSIYIREIRLQLLRMGIRPEQIVTG